MATELATERNILLDAMGCASKPWILAKYLNMIIRNDTGIRKQDGPRVFQAVANNNVGHFIAFEFLRTNWEKINEL